MIKLKYIIFIVLLICGNKLQSQSFGFKGQLPVWTTVNPANPFQIQAGIRYIPEFTYNKALKRNYTFDAELSVNSYISGLYLNDTLKFNEKLKPYRIWFRFSSDRLELRAGLQKINFGSALMLRPLMWFDQIDPRDPLQLTDGVYGILGRYYFMNNANIWLWGLLGNENTKGWEFLPSNTKYPEIGGRLQLPFFTGEIAATYHHREIDVSGTPFDQIYTPELFKENRYAIDLKVDKIIGFWMEISLTHKDVDTLAYTKLMNLGFDYTFNLGNGLGIKSEYFIYDNSNKIIQKGQHLTMMATSLSYPVNFITNLNAILYYDFANKGLYRFINTSWTFNKWSFYAIAFWNPDKFQIYSNLGEVSLYAGAGFQLMAVFNH